MTERARVDPPQGSERGSTLKQGCPGGLRCLALVPRREEFIQQALSHFQVVVVNNITTKMEYIVSSFLREELQES